MMRSGSKRVRLVLVAGLAAPLLAACGSGSEGTTDAAKTTVSSAADAEAQLDSSAAAGETRRASPGCMGAPTRTAGLSRASITDADGTDHPYRLFEPDVAADEPTPLVLDLHGLTEPIDFHAESSATETVAGGDGATVVTPQGTPNPFRWNPIPGADNPDVIMLRTLIEEITSSHCIDLDRVYSQGISNGGIMSGILSCELDDVIAAVGLVSGIQRGCVDTSPIPVVVFWGELDTVLPYSGGVGAALLGGEPNVPTTVSVRPGGRWSPDGDYSGFPPVEVAVSQIARDNGCDAEPTTTMASEHVEHHVWRNCDEGADVEFYVVTNGGHTWPGSKKFIDMNGGDDAATAAITGVTTDEIDATSVMWEFFKAHPMQTPNS